METHLTMSVREKKKLLGIKLHPDEQTGPPEFMDIERDMEEYVVN